MTRTHADKDSLASILAYINTYLKYNGKQGLLDENKALEDVMCEVLNRIYGWKLENLNHVEKNFPGIDLGDWERGIGVQVTVEKTSSKINNTIAKIVKNEVYNKFPHLKILILGDKQASYSIRNDEKIVFDDEKDIIDFVDLLDVSSRMDFQGRHKLVVFLKQELGWEAENTQLRILTYEKVQKYQEEQHKENSYITILGLHKKLPIQDAWIKLNILTEEELKRKQTETQWDFLNQYDEYSDRRSGKTYDAETLVIEPGNKVVLAGPGMGKSTLCKKLFLQAGAMNKFAIKVRLWDVAGYMREGVAFEIALCKAMCQSLAVEFTKAELAHFFSIIILDGLDECGDYRRTVAKSIAAWGYGHPYQMIIVTSRPIGYDLTELADYNHYQILPMDEWQMESSSQKLMELVQQDCEKQYQWFRKRLQNYELHKLACRSPLVLGFMVQLSLQKKDFGNSKISLYQEIVNEWLQGSSRDNEKIISEVELLYGIEAIAFYMMSHVSDEAREVYTKNNIITYVGERFTEEMEYPLLKAKKIAEQCLEFWLERGILDKGFYKGQECFLFLHLNVGEYLAACYLTKMSLKMKKEWVHNHYRENIWQETLRMAIACDYQGIFVEELIVIESKCQLPEGAVFLAAQGISESNRKNVPQELYDKMFEYCFGDNKYLSQKTAMTINCLKGAKINWHIRELESYASSEDIWKKMIAYHVILIALSDENDKLQIWARKYVIDYRKVFERNSFRPRVNDLPMAVGFLQTQGNDKELTEAIKKISFEDISVYEIEIIGKYMEAIGEGEWFNKRYEGLMAGAREFQHALVSKELGQSEERLIALLIAIFGVETSEKVEICREYSKIIAVLNYMESGIADIRWLGRDLQRKHSQEFVKLICITVDLDLEQLKKELYSLSHFGDKNSSFVSYDHTVHLHLKGEWSRCRGEVSAELLEEALSSHSGILGVCACYMAYYNIDKPDIVELLVKLFRASAEDRIVKRVGIVLKAGGYKELEVDAEERLIDDSILSFPCLFDYLSKIPDIENGHADRWLSCIEHGLAGNRYLVISALKYVLSLRKESISENIRTQLESMIKGSYNKWKKKKIRCLHCKEEVFIKPNGFCPKCSVGTELPTKYFIEALVSFSSFTMEEYIHLCSHPMSDVSAIAKRELQKIWIAAPNKLEYVIDNFEKLEYDGCIFELILQLPSQITCPYGMALKRLGMEISEEMQLIWLGNLRSLEWISAECMKTMVCESLSDESDAIRNKAMKCWLGEKDFWWENFA